MLGPISVLYIDDDADVVTAARLLLETHKMMFAAAASPEAAWGVLAAAWPDVIMLDLNFARSQTDSAVGLQLLKRLLLAEPTAAVVVVTGHSGVAVAVAAMRGGAADFVMKPWNNDRLVDTIARAATLSRARRAVSPSTVSTPLLGESPAIECARGLIAKVSRTRASVLIHGPAGTGKTLVAQVIQRASGFAGAPFVVVEGAAFDVETLARAKGGTVLIENADALSAFAQATLATALSTDAAPRLLATTRLSPHALREIETLGDELRFALATVEIALPPLPERAQDARLLASHYLSLLAYRHDTTPRMLHPQAAAAIDVDPWPGGVRQLIAACERAVVLGEGDTHTLAHFALSAFSPVSPPRAITANLNLAQSERVLVEAALKRNAHNVSRAAQALGLTRAALYRRMDKHGL